MFYKISICYDNIFIGIPSDGNNFCYDMLQYITQKGKIIMYRNAMIF